MRKGFGRIRCPKCKGNIYFEPDYNASLYGHEQKWFGWCLQCGYTLYLRKNPSPVEEIRV